MLTCWDTGSMIKQKRSKTNRGPWSRTGTIPIPWLHLGAKVVKTHEPFHFPTVSLQSLSFFEVMFVIQYISPCCISLHFSFDGTSHLNSLERPCLGDCLTVAQQLFLDRTFINSWQLKSNFVFLSFLSCDEWTHTYINTVSILPLKPMCVKSVWEVCLLLSERDIHL